MLNRKLKTILLVLIGIAIIAALYIAIERGKVESNNKNVEIVAQWDVLVSSAEKDGFSEYEMLDKSKEAVNAFIFKEMTINDLIAKNIVVNATSIELRSGLTNNEYNIKNLAGESITPENIPLEYKYLWIMEDAYTKPLVNNLAVKSNALVNEYTVEALGKTYGLVGYDDVASELHDLGLVFDTDAMKRASEKGYYVIPRFTTWANYSEGDMGKLASPLVGLRCGGIMFNDKIVAHLNNTNVKNVDYSVYEDITKGLEPLNAPVILIEFYNQRGLSSVIEASDYNLVRMHSIADNEITGAITPELAFNRYILAVNERNVRILFLKPFMESDYSSTVDFGKSLVTQLEKDGFTMGKAEALGGLPQSNLVLILIAFGISAGLILLGEKLRLLKISMVFGVLTVLGATGLAVLGNYVLAARVLGLLAAVIFPTLGIITWVGEKQSLGKSLLTFAKISAVTLVGAIFIVGLFPLKAYMNSIGIFSGIKLAMIAPLLIIFVYCIFLRNRLNILNKATNLAALPVRYGELLVVGILGIALMVLLLRSGNEGLQVSSLELAFRAKLEDVFMVRPRTKEFLIGIPCLLVALNFGYKDYLLPLWLLGAIGQVSMLNTFCHFHTPLIISVIRTFNGIWIGLVLGCIAILVLRWAIKKFNAIKV